MLIALLNDSKLALDKTNVMASRLSWWSVIAELLKSFGLIQHVDQPTHNLVGILDVVVEKSDLAHPAAEVVNVGMCASDHHLVGSSSDRSISISNRGSLRPRGSLGKTSMSTLFWQLCDNRPCASHSQTSTRECKNASPALLTFLTT